MMHPRVRDDSTRLRLDPPASPFLRGFLARTILGYVVAAVGTALLVLGLLSIRDDVGQLIVGFAFLTLVVIAVAVGGLGSGILASVLGFLAFNFFFIRPFGTFRVHAAEDVVVLSVFLGISVLISVLVARARSRAEAAEAREEELRLQLELSRSLVEPRPGTESYGSVLRLVVDRFGFRSGSLLISPGADQGGLVEVATAGAAHEATEPGPVERLVLNVGRRNLGVMVLSGPSAPLSGIQRRILETFGNQLALLLERDRLLRTTVRMAQAGGHPK